RSFRRSPGRARRCPRLALAFRSRRGTLTDGLHRRLVGTQALEAGMAQLAVVGPLGEAHLRDQARLHPMRVAEARRAAHLRRVDLVLAQLGEQLLALLRGKAGPHLSRELERATLVHAEQQRADSARGSSFAGSPPDDGELL